jgi:hypothetical protein
MRATEQKKGGRSAGIPLQEQLQIRVETTAQGWPMARQDGKGP